MDFSELFLTAMMAEIMNTQFCFAVRKNMFFVSTFILDYIV